MKNKNKKILITLLFLAKTVFATYEFDLNYGFGVSELKFNSVPGMAISIYPVKNFGFSAGIQYSWRWQEEISEQSGANPITIDSDGDALILMYSIDKWKEKLSAKLLQFPILLKYSDDSYYAAVGVKIGTVQNASVSVDYSGLETKGCISNLDPSCHAPLPSPAYQGFGKQKDSSFNAKISSKNLIMLAMEGGIKLKLNDNVAVLVGAFADYSFNKGFNRNLKPIVERVENKNSNGASIAVNDKWKSWQPMSIGIAAKISFAAKQQNTQEEICVKEPLAKPLTDKQFEDSIKSHSITVKANIPPQPDVLKPKAPLADSVQEQVSIIPDLPEFLLNRKADFVFFYPESRANPTDSVHLALTQQIANVLREKPSLQLHCVGYSEKLLSESVAYETALQRTIAIRSNLTRFYGIEERRIFIYSQGLKNIEFRRTECFVVDNP